MSESFLIALREGFEAALVISIVLAYARRSGDRRGTRWIWMGTAAAIAVATVAGIAIHMTIDDLEGVARYRTFAVICVAAAGLLTWMIFWMATHGRQLKSHLEARTAAALEDDAGAGFALALVAFTAVLREGLETALFLLSTTASAGGRSAAIGTLLGLAGAVALGVLVYRGSERIQVRRFFQVTGGLIVLFAAGLAAKAVMLLQLSGDLESLNQAVYDLSRFRFLTGKSQSGRFLAGIFGWDAKPSIEQVAAYLGYLVPVGWAYLRMTRQTAGRAPARTGAEISASAVSSTSR